MPSIKQLIKKDEPLTGGHRACAGCGGPIIIRQILLASPRPVVVTAATGCMEVVTTIFPFTAWKTPFLHVAFENAGAACSGVESMYRALKKKGKISEEMEFVAFGGDGGTYDIGFQSLSGAMERGHNMLYVCYDNEAYMNTGIQRSSGTPRGANTTTAPAGKVKQGKEQYRKDLTAVMAAHRIPYVAQSAVGFWNDVTKKAEKAFNTKGPKFINVLQPCPLGWGFKSSETIGIGKLAVETCFWPLYEVEDGKWKLTYKPKEKKPLVEYLKRQTRFKHLFKPGNEQLLQELQAETDKRWEELLVRCGEK